MRINIYVHGGPRKDRRVFPRFPTNLCWVVTDTFRYRIDVTVG